MRAVRFHDFGGPEVLVVEDVEIPEPSQGEVQLKVAATSYNPIDSAIRANALPLKMPLPVTTGLDVSGTITAIGDGVADWKVGDAVIAYLPLLGSGGAAEYTLVPAGLLAPAPRSVTLIDAAALPLVGLTAWQALTEHAGLPLHGNGDKTVLVQGAGGAVGRAVVQIAKAIGARVVAVTGEPRRAQATADGADVTFSRDALAAPVPEPVDVAINLVPAGHANLERLVPGLRPGGALISMTAPVPDHGGDGIRMLRMGSRSDATQLEHIVALVDDGRLDPHVADVVGLGGVRKLHEAQTSPGGKTVIEVAR